MYLRELFGYTLSFCSVFSSCPPELVLLMCQPFQIPSMDLLGLDHDGSVEIIIRMHYREDEVAHLLLVYISPMHLL